MTKQNKIFLAVAVLVVLVIFFVRFFLGVSSTAMVDDSGSVSYDREMKVGDDVAFNSVPSMQSSGYLSEQANIMPPVTPGGGTVTPGVERMVIKTGELSMVVKDVRTAVSAISSYALKSGGFVVSSNVSKPDIASYATIVIRIPVNVFDSGVTEVKSLGQVESESVNGSDVTEAYVDLSARLKNLQATEQQFIVIMRQAVKISDILEVQQALTQVRGEIESMQGRMNYLKDSASFSTLTVNLSTNPSALPVVNNDNDSWKPFATIKDAARTLLIDLQYIAEIVIWFVVYIPFWILCVVGLWIVWKGCIYGFRKFQVWKTPQN